MRLFIGFMKSKFEVSGSTIKIVAIVAMFIDHIAAVILEYTMPSSPVYWVMRLIGRLGFPIFCFLLVEGYKYTRSKKKYAIRLFLFALISEVPFDLAFRIKIFDIGYQNVYFTLFLGFITIWAIDEVEKRFDKNWQQVIGRLIAISAGGGIAYLLNTDYSIMGVLTIVMMFTFRSDKVKSIAAGCFTLILMSVVEITSLITIPLIMNYNGKRGLNLKYVFYAFYPVHIAVLYGIRLLVLGM